MILHNKKKLSLKVKSCLISKSYKLRKDFIKLYIKLYIKNNQYIKTS